MTTRNPKICPHCGIPQQWEKWRHCHCGYYFGPAEPPQPSPPLSDKAKVVAWRYGTIYYRFLAYIVDGLIFLPLGYMDKYLAKAGYPTAALLAFILGAVAFPVYSVMMNARYGQTLGKMSVGLKVLDSGEERIPTLKQAFLRDIGRIMLAVTSLIYVFSPRPATEAGVKVWLVAPQVLLTAVVTWTVLEILCVFLNDKRRALHDYIAGTVVVRTTKPRRS